MGARACVPFAPVRESPLGSVYVGISVLLGGAVGIGLEIIEAAEREAGSSH